MFKDTPEAARSQRVFRVGRIHLRPGPGGRGSAICPVLVPFEGRWSIAGLVRVELRRVPTTHRERRRARRSALRQVLAALEAGS